MKEWILVFIWLFHWYLGAWSWWIWIWESTVSFFFGGLIFLIAILVFDEEDIRKRKRKVKSK